MAFLSRGTLTTVMAGLVLAIHVLGQRRTWMPGTRPGMTNAESRLFVADHCDGMDRQFKSENSARHGLGQHVTVARSFAAAIFCYEMGESEIARRAVLTTFEWIIALLLGAVLLSALARRIKVPYPTFLAIG